MKITVERDKLLTAFQTVAPVVQARSVKPILQNIKMVVSGNGEQATLLGTDLEIGLQVNVSGLLVERPGQAILPLGRFGLILRESSDDQLVLEADDSGIIVQGIRSKFRLPGEDPHEFPMLPEFKSTKYFQIEAKALREVLRRTNFATDPDTQRFALGGVLLEFADNMVTAVGTDGRRMAVAQAPAEAVGGAESTEGTTIVPSKAVTLLERALGDSEGTVKLAFTGNDVLVSSERAIMNARLLEGRFPRWRDVLPDSAGLHTVETPIGPIYAAVRQAKIVTTEESIGVSFRFSEGSLTLSATAMGESQVELPLAYTGPDIAITLNPDFLTEFFRVLDSNKTVTISLRDGDSAALWSTDDGYRYVVMPLSRDD